MKKYNRKIDVIISAYNVPNHRDKLNGIIPHMSIYELLSKLKGEIMSEQQ